MSPWVWGIGGAVIYLALTLLVGRFTYKAAYVKYMEEVDANPLTIRLYGSSLYGPSMDEEIKKRAHGSARQLAILGMLFWPVYPIVRGTALLTLPLRKFIKGGVK